MLFLENNWHWLLIATIVVIGIIVVFYLKKKKTENKAENLKEEKYKIHTENFAKVSELITIATKIFNTETINQSENNEENLELIKEKCKTLNERLNRNSENYSERTISITNKITTTTLNSYFLLKKIYRTQSMNMPLENIAPLIDELSYIYTEDIENGFPILQKNLKDEINKLL